MALVLLIFMGSVSASDVNNNQTQVLSVNDNEIVSMDNAQEILGDGDSGNFSELITEIGSGGDKELSKKIYTYDSGDTIQINTSGTIDGKGAVIDMAGSNITIFNITNASVTFKNLTFKNANITNYGAAIFSYNSNLTLIGCEFLNNSAKRGGAVYAIDSAEIIIRDSIFMNNSAMDDGGAVYLIGIFSNFVFENSRFRNNYVRSNISSSAGSGGAVYIVSSKGFLKNCVFELNHATHTGGAVGLNDVIGTVENCVFNNNFVNITFSSTSSNGGALYLHNGNNTVINSNFTNNSAVNGGAIRTDANTARDGILNLKNSSFFNNSAINFGGALELYDFTAYISNCSFKFNNASNNVGGATDGGAIRSLSILFIENSTFENNFATSRRSTGGAINHQANDFFLKNSTFINNHAYNGGAIYTSDACVSAYDSTFINNHADYQGGAMYIWEIYVWSLLSSIVFNCTFINNTADDEAGAIEAMIYDTGILKINNSVFKNNSAVNASAVALNFADAQVSVFNSTFENNIALSEGGAISIYDGGFCYYPINNEYISNSTFINNTAVHGGAIYCEFYLDPYYSSQGHNNIIVSNSTFKDNKASYGGAIYNKDVFNIVVNSTFTNNGGITDYAIYNNGNLSLNNNSLSNIIYNGGLIVSQVNSTVLDNTTWNTSESSYVLYATLVDDKSNRIYDSEFKFVVNNQEIAFEDYNPLTGIYNATYIISNERFYIVNVTSSREEKLATKIGIIRNISGTYADLQDKINKAILDKVDLVLPYDFIYTEEIDGISFPDGVLIANNVTIDGNGHSINGNNTYRIFKISADAELKNINFVNGSADKGGAIFIDDGTTKIINSSFDSNYAGANKNSIYLQDASLYLENNIINTTYAEIVSSNGVILSGIDVVVLDGNKSIPVEIGDIVTFNATVCDDKGNLIYDSSFNFTVDNNEIPAVPGYEIYTAQYTIKHAGETEVGMKYIVDNLNVETGIYYKPKSQPELNVSVVDDKIIIELPENATGNVTVSIDGENQTVPLKDGKAVVDISNLDPGNYTANVTYPGDENYLPANNSTSFEVPKISDYPMNITSDENKVIVNVPQDATGDVIITIDGNNYTVPIKEGQAVLETDLPAGFYDVNATYLGNNKYALKTVNGTIFINNYTVSVDDLVKYYTGPEKLNVSIVDYYGKGIAGKKVLITINGITYTKITDNQGIASLAINLNSGNYTAHVEAEEFKFSKNVTVEVRPTIFGNDVAKVFRNGTNYYGLFLDGHGKPLVDVGVSFNINGIFYTRTTNATGWANLNINLPKGEFILTALNTVTGEMMSNNVTVYTLIQTSDLTKYYRNDTQFIARIVAPDGSYVGAGEEVHFNIHGRLYTKYTNATGHIKLDINLPPDEYIITSYYKDCREGNTITVLPVLSADNLVMKYGDGSKFTAKLLDGQGNVNPNQVVNFNVNGVSYNRTTDDNGEAKLNINLPKGEYLIESSYNEETITNTIIIY